MQQDQGDKEILLYTVCKMVVIGGGVCERIIKWDLFSRVNNLRVSEKLYNCSPVGLSEFSVLKNLVGANKSNKTHSFSINVMDPHLPFLQAR